MKQHNIQIKKNTCLENDYVKSHMLRTKIKNAESLLKCSGGHCCSLCLEKAGLGGDSAG